MGENDDRREPTVTRLGTPAPFSRAPSGGFAATTPGPTEAAEQEGTAALAPGLRIHQYELIRELGRGGMGIVYAARDVKLGRRVAIKFLRDADREVNERFLIEARATAQCNHDNIVIIYEVDEYRRMPYMVLELLEGQTLRGAMGPFGVGARMTASRTVEIGVQIARALARAHERGIVHRDLKPENVFVTTSGQVKVLDFGIAKALGSAERTSAPELAGRPLSLELTRAGAMVGTLPYMSPEQMWAKGDIDHRVDLWALGIILFEMLSGEHPLGAVDPHGLIAATVMPDPYRSIGALLPDLPEPLIRIVDQLLRKTKAERIARADELARRLETLLPGRPGRQLEEGESPYVGLTAFQETDADRFFGRSRDVAKMVARVRERPLTGVIGPSGIGKSSFVRAGLGPALKASGETWEVVTVRPGRQPLAALASIVLRMQVSSEAVSAHETLIERLRSEPGYLGALLRARAAQIGGQLLLFVDQFEELYTLVQDQAERLAFTGAISGVADDTAAPVRVIVSMRSDFLDRVGEDPQLTEELSKGLGFLTAPDRAGLREALVQPIEMVGYRFETEAMVGDMLDALGGTFGALPLLQFAAAKLWDARDRERKLLTLSSYHAIGGIGGALATHADEVVAAMSPRSQALMHRVVRRLVTPERTRAIVELADLQDLTRDRAELDRVLDQLVAARLLVVQTRGTGGGSVELVHESLIETWPRLRRWLDEDQEDASFIAQLAAAAKQWDAKNRPTGMLWRGEAMEEARRWYGLRPRELAARDQAFLDAVFALARRGRRARQVALIGAFVALAAGAGGATIAYVRVRAANQEASNSAIKANAEAERANLALVQLQQKDAERLSAEQKALEAENGKADAEDSARIAGELAKQSREQLEQTARELLKSRAELQLNNRELLKNRAELQQNNRELLQSREQLQSANTGLEAALADARAARERAEKALQAAAKASQVAEKASQAATKSAADFQRANSELQLRLERERALVKQLEEEKKKISTQLKE
ncbi:MAG: serine/threonine protein kinase [Myxococcales bacterium]|nr:serine/threonine protein kinase [Myxococcales bacterium]